jgi:hypothetical protein
MYKSTFIFIDLHSNFKTKRLFYKKKEEEEEERQQYTHVYRGKEGKLI